MPMSLGGIVFGFSFNKRGNKEENSAASSLHNNQPGLLTSIIIAPLSFHRSAKAMPFLLSKDVVVDVVVVDDDDDDDDDDDEDLGG